MKKRKFLKITSIAAAGSMVLPLNSCTSGTGSESGASENGVNETKNGFTLPDLDYPFEALEPHIDSRTMQIHHGKHHAGYVKKLNAALESDSDMAGKSIEELMGAIGKNDTALRNNGGGHYNHTLFWKIMSPQKSNPGGDLLSAIKAAFGDTEKFSAAFKAAATGRFGSGWAWLVVDTKKKLEIVSTANQDNPLMAKVTGKPAAYPILGIDVWEHAYYLNYQNRRGDYIDNFMQVINWDAVAERFVTHIKQG